MNCITIDDDNFHRKIIEECITKTPNLKLIGSFPSVKDALNTLKKNTIDLVFLDMEMPEISGTDFIKTFRDIPQIIIISSKNEYAAEAFNYDVTDYIVKPYNYDRFLKAVIKAQTINENFSYNKTETPQQLFIKKDGSYFNVDVDSISYIEALGDYVHIYTQTQRFTILSTMKAMEAKLPENKFVRIHNSYIVNIKKIKQIDDVSLVCNEQTLPISRARKADFFEKLNFL